ncbi:MAG: hypothetical protein U9N59_08555 [Campylobacterota bacterium]|nr:hypothetical protein [Campylobacterota bacterium]
MLQLKIKKANAVTVDGTHQNFIGTPLQGLDFKVEIGNNMTRSQYQKAIRDNDGLDKAVFMLHIASHDIVFQNEDGTVIDDFNETVDKLYEDKNTVPAELFNTIFEEISKYLGIKSKEDEKKSDSVENTQNGTQGQEATVQPA